jgi:hypothetical protein
MVGLAAGMKHSMGCIVECGIHEYMHGRAIDNDSHHGTYFREREAVIARRRRVFSTTASGRAFVPFTKALFLLCFGRRSKQPPGRLSKASFRQLSMSMQRVE